MYSRGDGYLDKVERLVGRLAAREVGPEDVEGALGAALDVMPVDVDVPTKGGAEARLLKAGVKRLTRWYFKYLAEQVDDIALALLRLGEVLAARGQRTESATAELARRLEALEHKVAQLGTISYKSVAPRPGTEDSGGSQSEEGQSEQR
ncbi:MAG TPA: hypothetical protein VME20_10460 [Acidimicrobiales bacterium]|nr:hypothetical protein [Acidimicrobiales bacterium]